MCEIFIIKSKRCPILYIIISIWTTNLKFIIVCVQWWKRSIIILCALNLNITFKYFSRIHILTNISGLKCAYVTLFDLIYSWVLYYDLWIITIHGNNFSRSIMSIISIKYHIFIYGQIDIKLHEIRNCWIHVYLIWINRIKSNCATLWPKINPTISIKFYKITWRSKINATILF